MTKAAANIWLVDDDALYRELLAKILNREPDLNCTRQFSSGADVLAALKQEPKPDVVVLDNQMPGMSGIEAIQHIKKLAPNTAVLLLTTFLDSQLSEEALAAGAKVALSKSRPVETIISTIRTNSVNQAVLTKCGSGFGWRG